LRPHLDVVGNGRENWPEGLNLVAQQVEGVGLVIVVEVRWS